MSSYGLSSVRDNDGNLQVVEHTYEWNGQEVTIKFTPPTIQEQDRLENMGDDVDPDELEGILNDKLVEPSLPDGESWTMREMMCYMEGMIRYSVGGELGDAVQEELEARQDSVGN